MEDLRMFPEKAEEVWRSRLNEMKAELKEQEDKSDGKRIDPILKSLVDLVEISLEMEQYRPPAGRYENVTRLCKVRVPLSKKEIEKLFNVKTYSMYGVGLFVPIEGMLLSRLSREDTLYDKEISKKKGINFDFMPDNFCKEYDVGLTIPAMSGLFVPKKCPIVNWITRTYQIQYFDITI